MKYQEIKCPSCESNKCETLYHYKDNIEVNQAEFFFNTNEVVCKICGFIYTNPAPVESLLEQYYGAKYLYSGGTLDYNLENRVNYLEKVRGSRNKLLEIGSGEGSFIRAVSRLGIEATGMEPNKESGAIYSSKHIDNDSLFDLVVSNHVLEHIVNPVEFLSQLHDCMLPKGLLIFEVPNLHMYGVYATAISHEHVSHFTPASLSYLMRRCGFEVLDLEYREVSRPLGFTVVAQKEENRVSSIIPSEYEVNKSYFLQAVSQVKKRENDYKNYVNSLIKSLSKKQNIVLWGANSIAIDICKCIPQLHHSQIIVVDSNKNRWKCELSKQYPIKINNPDYIKELKHEPIVTICAISWAQEITTQLLGLKVTDESIHIAPFDI